MLRRVFGRRCISFRRLLSSSSAATASDLLSKLQHVAPGPIALVLTPRRSSLALIPLLAGSLRGGSVLLSTSPTGRHGGGDGGRVYQRIRNEMKNMGIDVVELGQHKRKAEAVRDAASWCVERDVRTLVTGDTMVDAGRLPLTRFGETIEEMVDAGKVGGLEVLPPGVLHVWRPLIGIPPETVDKTVENMQFEGVEDMEGATEAEKERSLGVSAEEAVAYGKSCRDLGDDLEKHAADLLRECIVDVNHWGYIVFRRKILQDAFHDPDQKYIALTALKNMLLHVSGSEKNISYHDQDLLRFAYEMLGTSRYDHHPPAGRTLRGGVLRPAGRQVSKMLERLKPADWKRHRRRYQRFSRPPVGAFTACTYGQIREDEGCEFLIMSREPDSESMGLRGKRLAGNTAACILDGRGEAVYWDNRYVICSAKVETLEKHAGPVPEKTVLLASLKNEQEIEDHEWEKSTFYVRQLRESDWKEILSVSRRIHMYRVPFQCICGLPIILEKDPQSLSVGRLAASPHLGLSSRPDMFFTAVRVPRYRCLPDDLEPGFRITEKHPINRDREARRAW